MSFFAKLFGGGKGRKFTKVNLEKRFALHNRVGAGSMSKTWRATDTKTGQEVCLKVLDKRKTEALKKRFVGMSRHEEGDIAVKLQHPNIVRTFEWGLSTKGEEYLVMEFVQGMGMNFLVETRAPQLVGQEIPLLIQAADAIGYFHDQGYIHRDICPRNLMVTKDGLVKLIDFGLAVPDTPEFRKPGNRTGTANYMAPELIRRAATDKRIDIFSFGVTAYEAFTGTLPWESAESMQAMLQHLNTPPRDPREFNPDVNPAIIAVLMKLLAREPASRYQTMADVRAALQSLAKTSPRTSPPARNPKN